MDMKKFIASVIIALTSLVAAAQQPQTQTDPTFAVNAQFVNGVAPGYAPTAGSGLTLNLGSGAAFCAGGVVTYTAGTKTLTASTTSYVYLDPSASCAPAVNTTGFTTSLIPIATVVTGSSTITTITDDRLLPTQGGTGGGGSVTWPTSGKIVVSNGTSTPAGIAEVDGDCVVGISGAWAAATCPSSSGIANTTVSVASGTLAGNSCSTVTAVSLSGVATSGAGSHVTGSYT